MGMLSFGTRLPKFYSAEEQNMKRRVMLKSVLGAAALATVMSTNAFAQNPTLKAFAVVKNIRPWSALYRYSKAVGVAM